MLSQGVSVRIPDGVELRRRVLASSGTEYRGEFFYEKWSVVPKSPWRELTGAELESFSRPRPLKEFGSIVWIVNPQSGKLIVSAFNRMRSRLTKFSTTDRESHLKLFRSLNQVVEDYSLEPESTLMQLGISCNLQGMETTTIDKDNGGKRIGLHIDSFFPTDAGSRASSPNRICINLGPEPRYFLFLDRTVADMCAKVQSRGFADPWSCFGPDVVREFFRLNPEHPVFRLQVDPGEAYIAPTENIPHDSTTSGKKHSDYCFTAIGFFSGP